MLIFNKQYRNEQKLISEIYKKIRKSAKMEYLRGNTEIYKLDSIDVLFDILNYKLSVKDKSGKEIYIMDCKYPEFGDKDELQLARNDWFSALLDFARTLYKQRSQKQEKMKQASENAKTKAETKQKEKVAEQAENAAVLSALEEMRNL